MEIGRIIKRGTTVDVPDELPIQVPEPETAPSVTPVEPAEEPHNPDPDKQPETAPSEPDTTEIPERETLPDEDEDPLFPDYVPEEWPEPVPEPEPTPVEPEPAEEPQPEPTPEKEKEPA